MKQINIELFVGIVSFITSALWAIIGGEVSKVMKLISWREDPRVTAIQLPPELKTSLRHPARMTSRT